MMARVFDFDFFLAPESAVALEESAFSGMPAPRPAERKSAEGTASAQAEAWARRAMASSGFGDAETGGPELPAAARLFIEET
jgi:hypothetical protein